MRIPLVFDISDQHIELDLRSETLDVDIELSFSQIVSTKPDAEIYEGSYQITPNISGQTISTARKYLTEDMSVNPIPYAQVSNDHGGMTVIIGG